MSPDNILANISEIEIVSLTIYGEARGESILGQIAVGCVIRNRAIKNDESYQNICLKPKQFSCWNPGDNNRALLIDLATKMIHNEDINEQVLNQCVFIAGGIVNESIMDITHGATNYLTEHLFNTSRPSWALNPINVRQVDSQIFFNV